MRRTPSRIAAAGLLFAAASYGPTAGAGSVFLEFRDFTATMTDLQPSDGVAPSLFLNGAGFSALALSSGPAGLQVDRDGNSLAPGNAFDASVFASVSSATTRASVSTSVPPLRPNGLPAPMRLTLSGETLSPSSFIASLAISNGNFTLSPYTALSFSGIATGRASASTAWPEERADGRSFFMLTGYTADGTLTQRFDRSVSARTTSTGLPAFDSYEEPFTLQIANLSSSSMQGSFSGSFSGTGSAVAPVPEPSTYGLMVAGLGLLAAFARRRRARDKAA